MARPRSVASHLALVALALGPGFIACSSASQDPSADPPSGADAAGEEIGGNTSKDAGFDSATSLSDTRGAGSDVTPADSCVSTPGPDEPDDDFIDSNCDGIDGDASRAIFVAPSGVAGAPGTMSAPLGSLAEAVTAAAKDKKAIYLCNATYTEGLALDGAAVSVYGGYDCKGGWKRVSDRAVLAPKSGMALSVTKVADLVVIDRVEARAVDARDPGGTSMAALITDSAKVSLKNDVFDAGYGADGKTPDAAAAFSPAWNGGSGESMPTVSCARYGGSSNPAACGRGGAGGVTDIPESCMSPGGVGGTGGFGFYTKPTVGEQGYPIGIGGPASGVYKTGLPGRPGVAGTPGSPSKSGFGIIFDDKYVATNSGTAGSGGTGGGGGSGGSGGDSFPLGDPSDVFWKYFYNGGGGGEGAWGGCGGHAGSGGGGGGASIAIYVRDSSITIARSTISTHNGGRGGDAGPGGDGQVGGVGGVGGAGTSAGLGVGYAGGNGGSGGRGGPGGAGGGGPSIGILINRGASPSTTDVTYHIGSGGKGGHGLLSGDGADGELDELRNLAAPSSGDAGASDGSSDAGAGG